MNTEPAASGATGPRVVRGLVAACHLGPTFAVTAAVTMYAVVVGRSGTGVALVGVAVLFGQLTTGWQNDAIDAELDASVGREEKPIVHGLVSRRTVGIAAVSAAVACVVASYASGWKAGTVHIGAVAMAAGYNAGLKRTAYSLLPYLGAFGLLPCFVTLGAPGSPWPPWSVPVAVALLGAGAHVLNVLRDASIDRLAGLRSLPLRLPPAVGWTASGAALVGSSALLAFGAHSISAPGVAALIATVALGVAAVWFGARSSPWGFRLACVIAVVDVGLLATNRR